MSIKSKREITSIVTGIIILICYAFYAQGRTGSYGNDLKAWAITMLIFIGIGVAAMIVIQILFHIIFAVGTAVKEEMKNGGRKKGKDLDKDVERIVESAVTEDEMDKIIGLKSSLVGSVCVGIAFIAALLTLAFGMTAALALNVLFIAFSLASIIQGIVKIYFYEKGV